uniref:Large ribosomal subunit protein bL28c n=1 Tax=Fibrocapsa japonica TaxID=94617 RepID=A0A7S2V663_9STRA|mmetsp:Transcript_626/g.904  ORF Transcript_626/g.904 Transcript_626/m.904 type:complete len:136 (+) Transcript_626:80-487(+)|eukprot:CAMPEP_0113943974 /NCGR_PEP_ID=MMETSP1339-20121228/30145_1 /TAXON_ID=94617 /ORGANISM="Fibrocapsa japonica" /LENGTH=135 /DNA_ID=CAMNT_0000948999 /DNA_START=80 /DNA_END=487 /DNA_ORIENTATION=+ /assembly_acc=CAM_ASM_000762
MALSSRHVSFSFLSNFIRGSGRASRGLYAGKDIRFGNSVSHSNRKTRRSFKPNVFNKRLWSDILDRWIPFKVSAHALRCIDHAGGLDNYILRNSLKTGDWDSTQAVRARKEMLEALEAKEKESKSDDGHCHTEAS